MASEIRVDKITSLSGVGTISPSPTGVEIAGITTVATLKATTGIVTTLTATTGIVTTLTANTTKITTGIVTTLTATTGIVTTLTTNTLTANSTTKVGSGVTLSPDGDIFATGVTTTTHTIVNTTANNKGLIINATGNNYPSVTGNAARTGADQFLLNIRGQWDDTTVSNIILETGGDTTNKDDGVITFKTASAGTPEERLRITSDGKIGIGTTNPQGTFQIESTDPNFYITNQLGNSNPVNSGTIHFREAPATASFFITHRGDTNKLVIGGVNGSDTFSHITLPRASANIEAGANIVIPSGNGIDFSATANSNAGMTSELFDDYEEGVYTATSTNATWNTSQNLISYTKIGRLVTITAQILQLGGSGNLDVNLPFAAASGTKTEFASAGGVATYDQNHTESSASDGVFGLINNAGTALMLLQTRDNNDWIHLQCDAGAYLRFFITYVAA